jgi:hypothetical protein
LIESPLHNDAPVAVVNGDRGDLLVLTRWGKAVRFPRRAIAAPGSVALELDPGDEGVAALPLPSDTQILIVTSAPYACLNRFMRDCCAELSITAHPSPLT